MAERAERSLEPEDAETVPPPPQPVGFVKRTSARAQHAMEVATDRYELTRYLFGAYERFRRLNGSILAASIAFRVFLFLVPLTLVAVGLAGFGVSQGTDVQNSSKRLGAAMASVIAAAGHDSKKSWWLLVIGGLFATLYAASSLFSTLSRCSAQLWEMWEYAPSGATRRLRFIAGLVLAIGFIAVGRVLRTNLALGLAVNIGNIAAHLGLALLLLAYLPNRATRWHDLLPGAIVTAAGLIGLDIFTVVWLPHKLASLSQTYGTMGVAIAVLSYLALLGYLLVAAILTNVMWREYRLRTLG
jgi:membrane protein